MQQTHTKKKQIKGNPPIHFGPSILPNRSLSVCMCLFYFNIKGSFDVSNIYLVVFTYDWIHNIHNCFILKNNQWIEQFPNKHKLMFPKYDTTLMQLKCAFLVNVVFLLI